MALFDKDLVQKRFASHLKEYDELSVVQRDICERLSEKLSYHTLSHPIPEGIAYEIGAGTGFLTRYILNDYPNLKWHINDLVPQAEQYIKDIISKSNAKDVTCIWSDAEKLELKENVSLLISSSAMQWFNSVEDYLKKIYPFIAIGGLVTFSIFGKRNFIEVKTSSGGIGLEYPTLSEVESWAESCGFEVIMSEDYTQVIYFDSPSEVLNYIKQSGMNGNSSQKWTKNDFNRFNDYYMNNYTVDGQVSLTFNPIQFILKK